MQPTSPFTEAEPSFQEPPKIPQFHSAKQFNQKFQWNRLPRIGLIMFIIFFLIPLFSFSSESIRESFDLSNFHGVPSAIVGGHVNVITGDFIDYEIDCVLPGPRPFVLDRFYGSSQSPLNTLCYGWYINYDHTAKYYHSKRKESLTGHKGFRNYFVVADGMGSLLRYRGSHKYDEPGGIYAIEDSQWDKGLTNLGNEISGKSNVKNNEAWVEWDVGTLRVGNGDVFHFSRVVKDKDYTVPRDGSRFYRPSKKTKLNRITEVYEYNDHNLSPYSVEFLGNEGSKLGFFHFGRRESSERIVVRTPCSSIDYKFDKVNLEYQCSLLSEVKRPYSQNVKYSYELYENENYKEAMRVCRKSYPEDRFVEPHYYKVGKQTVHLKKNPYKKARRSHLCSSQNTQKTSWRNKRAHHRIFLPL